MTEHSLLYIIAVATALNATVWVVVLIFGLRMRREVQRLREETEAVMGEVLLLVQELRFTVGEVRKVSESGRKIAEEVVSAILLRRISPQWFPTSSALKVGVHAAREGIGLLRRFMQSRKDAEQVPAPGVQLDTED